jgi:hypothetical protein
MKKLFAVSIAMLAIFAMGSQAANANSPKLKGSWVVSLYGAPGRTLNVDICFDFVVTNAQDGVTKYSGTWTSPNIPSLKGQWIQLGDMVSWFNDFGGAEIISGVGNMITAKTMGGETWNNYNTSDLNTGNWDAKKKKCPLPGAPESSDGGLATDR